MLATAIIVFREILEAALIIGIVAAATQSVARRGLWILAGLVAGVTGALVVAGLADVIVEMADGMGQELFNALVLLLAVSMLAWHNIWMASHSRELVAQMQRVGNAVSTGAESMLALGLIVTLAVLREGSEIVLFLYGQAAGGLAAASMLAGGLAGLAVGSLVGLAMYLGLLRIPVRHLFSVTSWMILLLAAGMASQASKFLVQADYLPAWGRTWDTSALLANDSVVGSMLHTLIGYDATPMGMQLFIYLVTFTVIGVAMKIVNTSTSTGLVKTAVAVAVIPCFMAMADRAEAGPASKVYTPTVEYGETELELLGGVYDDNRDDVDGERAGKVAIGHGMTTWWKSEIELVWEREPDASTEYTKAEWVNVFQLSEPGEYFVDFGLFTELVFPDEHEKATKLEIGPMFQKEIGATVNNLNLIWVRDFGSKAEHNTEFEYAWQSRIKGNPALEFGVQGFGELGDWDDTNPGHDQEHKLGPAIFGQIKTGKHKIKYDAAILAGVTDDTPDTTFRFQLEYEM